MKVVSLRGVAGLILTSFLMTGCASVAPLASAFTGGTTPAASLEVHSQTTIKLEDANFVTVRTNLVGSSRGFKLLGFITLYPATLDKAMNRLYGKAQAEEGTPQTLANLMIEHSAIYVILFSIPKTTVRADLIEFVAPADDQSDDSTKPLHVRVHSGVPLGRHP